MAHCQFIFDLCHIHAIYDNLVKDIICKATPNGKVVMWMLLYVKMENKYLNLIYFTHFRSHLTPQNNLFKFIVTLLGATILFRHIPIAKSSKLVRSPTL